MTALSFMDLMDRAKKNASVLVVDDERGVRQSIEMVLKDRYDVYTAADAGEAVAVLSKKPVDVVLLDIRLPDADGVELIEVFKDIDPDAEIIMVTAVKEVQSAVQAIKAGAFEYLLKPFVVEDIQIAVSRALEKRGLMRQVSYLKGELQRVRPFERMVGSEKKC